MSYVRWSCDDYKSDVYAYQHSHGYYALYVAGRRIVSKVHPMPKPIVNEEKFREEYKKHLASVKAAQHEDIDHPEAGKHFQFSTIQELREKLVQLKAEGFHVPDHAFRNIDWEILNGEDEPDSKNDKKIE